MVCVLLDEYVSIHLFNPLKLNSFVLYTLIKQMGEIMMALSRRIVGQNHINKTRF